MATLHSERLRKLAVLGMLTALLAVLTLTPIGFLQIPPLVSITVMHIPVILGAVLYGPVAGGILGFAFGLLSMLRATFAGTGIGDWIFSPFMSGEPLSSAVMCFLPRILLGVVAGWAFLLLRRLFKNETLCIGVSAAVAALFHTISVLTLMWVLFRSNSGIQSLKAVFEIAFGLNGVLELAAAVILCTAIAKPILASRRRHRS